MTKMHSQDDQKIQLRKRHQKNIRKGSHFDRLDLPKPWKGNQKSRFAGFQQRCQKRPPKASVLEAFWAPKSEKTLSGRVPGNHREHECPKIGPRVEKGSQNGRFFLQFWCLFRGLLLGEPLGPLQDGFGGIWAPFLTDFRHCFRRIPNALCLMQGACKMLGSASYMAGMCQDRNGTVCHPRIWPGTEIWNRNGT